MLDFIIRLAAQGIPQVQAGLRGIGTDADKTGEKFEEAAKKSEKLDSALDKIEKNKAMQNSAAQAAALAEALSKVGANDGLARAEVQAAHLMDRVDRASAATENLRGVLEKTRNAGVALAAAGAGGLALEEHFVNVAAEGDGVLARLDSILKAQGRLGDKDTILGVTSEIRTRGHYDDDDQLNDAAVHLATFSVKTDDLNSLLEVGARQARSMGLELSGVADQLGKAYNDRSLSMLRRAGFAFSEQEEKALDAANAISEAAGRQKFMEIVVASTERNTVALGDSLTAAQAAANDFAAEGDNAMTAVGEGAGTAKAQVLGVLTGVLHLINASPGLEQAAGYLGYWVSGGTTVVGSLLGIGSQIGLTILGLKGMGITSVATFGEWAASAWAAAGATWAAMAPLLPLFLAIAAAALIATGAIWVLSGAKAAQDDANAQKQKGDNAESEALKITNERRKKRGLAEIKSQNGGENDEDKSGNQSDAAALQAQLSALQNGQSSAPAFPAAQIVATAPAPGAAPTLVAMPASTNLDSLEDEIDATDDKGEKKQLRHQMKLARRADRDSKARDREQKKLARDKESDAKKSEREKERDSKSKVKDALYLGARLDEGGVVQLPDGADDLSPAEKAEVARELNRKDSHDEAFGLGKYKPKKKKSEIDVSAYAQAGGSLFQLPKSQKQSRGEGGSDSDGDGDGERSGTLTLAETGRRANGDGTDTLNVAGTLKTQSRRSPVARLGESL